MVVFLLKDAKLHSMIIIEGENESWSWHEKFESDFALGGGFRSTPVNNYLSAPPPRPHWRLWYMT